MCVYLYSLDVYRCVYRVSMEYIDIKEIMYFFCYRIYMDTL